MSKLKVAILGTGAISTLKHIPAWKQAPNCDVVALCDIDINASQAAADKYGVPNAYDDLTSLLAKEKPDVVDVVTPPATHKALAIQCMEAGAHVMIEKPMGMNQEECQEIVDCSDRTGREVCVAHSDLFYLSFMKARKLVEEGHIGDFRGMRIWLNTPTRRFHPEEDHWCHKLPGGVIGETGPHIAYMTMAFVKNIHTVDAHAIKLLPEYPWAPYDDYRVTFVGENGISTCAVTYTCSEYVTQVDIIGADAILKIDLETQHMITYKREKLTAPSVGKSLLSEVGQLVTSGVTVGARHAAGMIPNTHEMLANEFSAALLNGLPSPVPAADGMECIRLLKELTDLLDAKYGAALATT